MRRALVNAALAGVLMVAGCSSPRTPQAGPGGASASASPTATASSPGAPSPGPPSPAPTTPSPTAAARYVFPVDGHSSYGRQHHDYPATDIFAACGTAVRAVTNGLVLEVSLEDRFDPSTSGGADRGGLFVSILGDDGVRYYGSHFSGIDAGVRPGTRIDAGTRIGLVGHTGNTNGTCHLHFGLSPVCARTGDWWIRRGVVWPWSYLDAWRAGTVRTPVAEVNAWHASHGCPPEPPS